jgi:predicted tellurium resistance membrane protein TerC
MTKRFCHGKKRTNKMLPEVSFWGLVGIMRTIAFMQSLRIGNVFFLIMYVGNILLSSSDVNLLLQMKKILSSKLTSLYISVKHHSFKELKFTKI